MNALIIDNGSSRIGRIKTLLVNFNTEVVRYDHVSLMNALNTDLIILSGGHDFPAVGNDDIYHKEIEIIKKVNKPIVGICLGFELIAYVYEGKLERLIERREGEATIEIVASDPVLIGLNNITVYESHRWVLTEATSPITSLARSTSGIEIIKHNTKPIYGFQFHPEHPKDINGRRAFLNVISTLSR